MVICKTTAKGGLVQRLKLRNDEHLLAVGVKPLRILFNVKFASCTSLLVVFVGGVCALHEQCTPVPMLLKNCKNTNNFYNSKQNGCFFSKG